MERKKLRVATDCSGIDAPIQALNRLGVDFTYVFGSESDRHCREVILANHAPETLYKDIKTRDHTKLKKIDLYIAGFPCQSFTNFIKGNKGLKDKSRGCVFYHCVSTIRATRPKAFVLENVLGCLTHNKGKTWEKMRGAFARLLPDYTIQWDTLNARDFGVPQNRPRVYMVGTHASHRKPFHFPQKIPLRRTVTSLLVRPSEAEDPWYRRITPNMRAVIQNRLGLLEEVDQTVNYIINIQASVRGFGYAMKEVSPCLLTNAPRFWLTKERRCITEREALRLQGFPDNFRAPSSRRQTFKQAGNSMTVDILMAIFRNLGVVGREQK